MKCARDWFARALTMCALVITRRYRLHDFLDIFSFCDVKFSFFFLTLFFFKPSILYLSARKSLRYHQIRY